MAKLLKIGSAVTEIEDIKIGTPEEIKEGTAKEAEPVSGEVDNSGNWTSITIGDTTGNIPQGQSTIKQNAVDKLNAGILDAASIETEYAERFSNDLYLDGNVYFEGDINVTSNSLYLGEDDTQVAAIDDRVGQYVGEEFKKFGYVEEVEVSISIAAEGITTIVADKLWYVLPTFPEGWDIGPGSLLEVYHSAAECWYKPTYINYDDENINGFSFICDDDTLSEGVITKVRILR